MIQLAEPGSPTAARNFVNVLPSPCHLAQGKFIGSQPIALVLETSTVNLSNLHRFLVFCCSFFVLKV